jgi:hypothetical protein
MKNLIQLNAIQKKNEERIKAMCPLINENTGIYVFTRLDENGILYAYIGQTVNLLRRAVQHLTGYQHIDLSIKKHGLFDIKDNPHGYKLTFENCIAEQLNELEQQRIKEYAGRGYQLRNKTTGSQGKDKRDIADEPHKGYLRGKYEGCRQAFKEIGEDITRYTTGLTSKGGSVADRKTGELKARLYE